MAKAPPRDVLLVNLGTPAAPTPAGVRAFLRELLSDPRVVDRQGLAWKLVLHGILLRARPRAVAPLYRSIWSPQGSPLQAGTQRMSAALAKLLHGRANVDYAFRYGRPSLEDGIKRAVRLDRERVTLVPLFPQQTGTTTGSIDDNVAAIIETLETAGMDARPRVALARIPSDCPRYVAALAARAEQAFDALGAAPDQLVVSFHGVPVRYDEAEGDAYSRACRATCDALVAALGFDAARTTLCFQSRFGREPWLAPATADVLVELPRRGARAVAVVCPGFLTEGLETLEEVGLRGRAAFEAAGGERFALAPAVLDHPEMIAALEAALAASGAC